MRFGILIIGAAMGLEMARPLTGKDQTVFV